MNSSVVRVGEPGSSFGVISGFTARRRDRGGFRGWFRRTWASVVMDQDYRAACVLTGIDERGEYITGIATSDICKLLQFG